MSRQSKSRSDDIDDHVVDEFITEYNYAHNQIETLLIALENNPQDRGLLDNLFRQVHSIKGNSQFMGMKLLTDFIHVLETVLDSVRKQKLVYDTALGDIILASVDQIGLMCRNARDDQSVDIEQLSHIQGKLESLTQASQATSLHKPQSHHSTARFVSTADTASNASRNKLPTEITPQQLQDLKFFARITESAEQRSPFWSGRTQRLLNIVLELNNQGNNKVDPAQLEAAVYLHDFGMAFLPLDILHKTGALTDHEYQTIKLHPDMGAALIADNPQWQIATQIIIQHHEKEDGTGYPNGLVADQICDGAKILAIADAFESMISHRANRSGKYPITQAIGEINNHSGSQFSPFWVSIFNALMHNKTMKN